MPGLPRETEVDMEEQNNTGGVLPYGERVRHLDVFGRQTAAFVHNQVLRDHTDITAETLATFLEAVAASLSGRAAVLRGGGVR